MENLIERFDAATDEERAAMLAEMTEEQKWELVAAMEEQNAALEAHVAALEADLPNLLRLSDANPFSEALGLYQRTWQRMLLEDLPVSGLVN